MYMSPYALSRICITDITSTCDDWFLANVGSCADRQKSTTHALIANTSMVSRLTYLIGQRIPVHLFNYGTVSDKSISQ